ncbi:N-acetylmuramoyl-L-alanine amidase CwlL [Halomicronema hongdechloris C2206]|uniref:Lysozyme n=1 Tax=Halomicronema hongdechloris C2206 TaxID=1641165 RepID=A0A1Z3HVL0_9CYAN|nr:peptidoglycan-binding protein [Halomicronema hongdechloris]ASC74177.1 N-acetylmuramoyl-L-alanine amidase CwlL [Halomicronema hongdechloris C2206]
MARVPQAGVAMIKQFEGCRLEAYPDPRTGGKPYTIGWGNTRKRDGSPFQLGERISQAEADALLTWHVEAAFLPPLEKIPVWSSLTEPQQGAILSFAYNLGAHFYGNRGFETITRVLQKRQWDQIEAALVLYRNPGSNVEEGLLRRRLSEANLFLSGTSGVSLSAAGRDYLASGRTYGSGARLSQQAQAYLQGRSSPVATAPTTPTATDRRTLYLTNPYLQGEDVKQAQECLHRKGAGLVVDGVFGPATKLAVERFQQVNGLAVDGVVGSKTWSCLLMRVLYLTEPYLTGNDVRQVQQALAKAGQRVSIDGVFGPNTEQAVKQFQASQRLVTDGIVGPKTLTRLNIG